MDWVRISLAGISGAMAALVASLVVRDRQRHRGPCAAVFAVTMLVIAPMLDRTVAPHIRAWQFRRFFTSDPAFSEIVKEDTQALDRMSTELGRLYDSGRSGPQIMAKARELGATNLGALLSDRIGRAPDDIVLAFTGTMVDTLRELQGDPDASTRTWCLLRAS
jgi:hypothetical protein